MLTKVVKALATSGDQATLLWLSAVSKKPTIRSVSLNKKDLLVEHMDGSCKFSNGQLVALLENGDPAVTIPVLYSLVRCYENQANFGSVSSVDELLTKYCKSLLEGSQFLSHQQLAWYAFDGTVLTTVVDPNVHLKSKSKTKLGIKKSKTSTRLLFSPHTELRGLLLSHLREEM